jgi:Fe-S cluster biogenesis protein NfuA
MMPFSDEDIYVAVKNNLSKVSEYVHSHGGGIALLGVKNGRVYIELTGTCGGCSMSLMTTKMVVQKKLREYIHPELEVINVDGTAENQPPSDLYLQEEKAEKEKKGLMDKVKSLF